MLKNRNFLKSLIIVLLLGVSTPTILAQCSGGHVDLTVAAEKTVNSVVYIKVTTNSKTQMVEYYDPFFDDFFCNFFGRGNGGKQQRRVETPKQQKAGSGVILSEDGYIVTNNHVVENADELSVKLNDNREFKARIIGTDPTTDTTTGSLCPWKSSVSTSATFTVASAWMIRARCRRKPLKRPWI